MTVPGVDDLRRRLRNFAYEAHYSKHERALIGGVDPASGAQVVEAPGSPGWVIVRVYRGQTMTQTKALNTRVKSAYGLPVWVAPNEEGALAVVGVREEELTAQVGRSAQALAIPDVVTVGLIDERRFEPGLVQARLVGGAYTLSVWINSFVYTGAAGQLVEWPGGWLSLAAHVPGAGLRRWVLVGIDTATNVAVAVNGLTYGAATTLVMTQLAAVDPSGMIPLAGINLAGGQPEIREEHILDARVFLGEAAATPTFLSLLDTPVSYTGKTGQLVVVNAAETGLEFQEAAGAGPFDVDLPPNTPSTYDDEFDDASVAVAWSELDPDGYQTVAEADGVLTLTNDATDTTPDTPTMLVRDVPVGDWAAATHVTTDATTNNILAGIGVTFPTAGNYVYLELVDQVSEKVLFLWLDAGGTKTFEASSALTVTDGCYLRLRYDDSESLMVGEYSLDGLSWSSVEMDISDLAEAPAAFGLCIRPWGNTDDVEAEFAFWRVVEAFGASTDPLLGDYGAPLALDAGQVGYTPATGADWTDPDPTTVQGALDTLAARESGASLTVQEADGTPTVANVDTIVVTNGTLTDDGGGQVTLDFGSAATDGSAIHDNEAGEIAAITEKETPVAADMLLIEDSEDDNAKKKVQIGNLPGGSSGGGLFTFTPPELADFAWVNQGAATATESNGRIYLYAPAVSGDQLRILKMTAPVTPYTVDIAFMPQLFNVDYNQAGFAWRQGSDGKIIAIQYAQNGSLAVHRFTNHTTWSAQAFVINTHMPKTPVVWYRMADNGTNRTVSWSVDGNNWIQLFSEGRTTFLTADEIGFYADSNNASYPAAMTLLSWKIT